MRVPDSFLEFRGLQENMKPAAGTSLDIRRARLVIGRVGERDAMTLKCKVDCFAERRMSRRSVSSIFAVFLTSGRWGRAPSPSHLTALRVNAALVKISSSTYFHRSVISRSLIDDWTERHETFP